MADNQTNKWLTNIKEAGYRLTGVRYAVVEILSTTDKGLNASEIYEFAHQKYPSISLVSVYRTLSILENLGLIQRIHQPSKCQAYLPAFTSHEHFILCTECGKVGLFNGDDFGDLINKVEKESRFQVQEHWLQFFGLCDQCQKSQIQKSALHD